jgi:adenosylhomocysteine nucleosidase
LSIAGVVAALSFEARTLGAAARRADGITLIRISGVGQDRARHAAKDLIASGADALMSWGTAGALDSSVGCGSILLATEVISYDAASRSQTHLSTSLLWRKRIRAALGQDALAVERPLLTCSTLVATPPEKEKLFRRTGAAAVDMESAAVAEVAAEHGLPFVAIRVIIDTARDSLPDALVRTLASQSRGKSPRLALPVLRAPAQWGQLARLALRYRTANIALRKCARVALKVTPAAAPEVRV